jgi:uncharacterized protein YbjT (DUF2867 family)
VAFRGTLARAGLSSGYLLAAAMFVSSAARYLARIAGELDPAAVADYGRVLAERLDPRWFPIMAELTSNDSRTLTGPSAASV